MHAEIPQELDMADDGAANPRSYSTYLKTRPASWYELFMEDLYKFLRLFIME